MARLITYRDVLRAKGIKPLPPMSKLRTKKQPGDKEQQPVRSKDCPAFVAVPEPKPEPKAKVKRNRKRKGNVVSLAIAA